MLNDRSRSTSFLLAISVRNYICVSSYIFCVIFIGVEQFIFTFVNVIIDGLSILPKISKQIVWILKYNDCIYLFIIVKIEFN